MPLSPIRLISPATAYAEVGVSIYEVRINVELGSTVIIDGTNVSTLIRAETGNVSKNVQVLPVGDNTISISVKSKYCRENKMEITLHRAPQEIPLELDATVIVEWNYEPITQEAYNSGRRRDAFLHADSLHQRHNAPRRKHHRRFPALGSPGGSGHGQIQFQANLLHAWKQRRGHPGFV